MTRMLNVSRRAMAYSIAAMTLLIDPPPAPSRALSTTRFAPGAMPLPAATPNRIRCPTGCRPRACRVRSRRTPHPGIRRNRRSARCVRCGRSSCCAVTPESIVAMPIPVPSSERFSATHRAPIVTEVRSNVPCTGRSRLMAATFGDARQLAQRRIRDLGDLTAE